MSQLRITKQRRTASAERRRQVEPPLPLDSRDPDIIRAKQLQRRQRRPSGPREMERYLRGQHYMGRLACGARLSVFSSAAG
jgi:hypothetical protein